TLDVTRAMAGTRRDRTTSGRAWRRRCGRLCFDCVPQPQVAQVRSPTSDTSDTSPKVPRGCWMTPPGGPCGASPGGPGRESEVSAVGLGRGPGGGSALPPAGPPPALGAVNSWWGFGIILAVILALAVQGGHIRLGDRRRRVA